MCARGITVAQQVSSNPGSATKQGSLTVTKKEKKKNKEAKNKKKTVGILFIVVRFIIIVPVTTVFLFKKRVTFLVCMYGRLQPTHGSFLSFV